MCKLCKHIQCALWIKSLLCDLSFVLIYLSSWLEHCQYLDEYVESVEEVGEIDVGVEDGCEIKIRGDQELRADGIRRRGFS